MPDDKLQVLLAVRRHSVQQARRTLAERLKEETRIEDRIMALEAVTRRDREMSGTWTDAPRFLEMSAIRTQATRAERQAMAAEQAAAMLRSQEARDVVISARMAAEAVEQLIGERQVAAESEEKRREQHVLDDIARAARTR